MYNIEQAFLFFGLNEDEKVQIKEMLPPPIKYGRGECVYDEKRFEKALGIVLDGTLISSIRKVIKRRFSPGDIFGAATLFTDDTEYISEIFAVTESTVQLIPEAVLRSIFAAHPETSVNYIKFLTVKVRFLNQKISQFSSPSASEKLYNFLRDSADSGGFVPIQSMSSLARQTGMGRTSLYRCLEELEFSKKVERRNNIIRVIEK